MARKLSILAVLFCLLAGNSGCVSEAVNQWMGKLFKDPNALETPEKPDEPIFDPQSDKLIVPSESEKLQYRFENK